ncbi:penicillin acylase family protein [Ramlibacter agri]|nr:penicillin acylase family protein [Ramlibacter agri]
MSPPNRSFALALAAAAALAACSSAPPARVRTVQIDRTTYGIAHITAPDYEGIGYGFAYAHAQDDLCLMADRLLTLRGERTRYLGAQGTAHISLNQLSNPRVDLFIRAHMDDAVLESAASAWSPDLQAAVRGYVAGYNRYLQNAVEAGTVPESCRGKPWLQPMTVGDVRRGVENTMILGSLGAFADAVLDADPPARQRGHASVDAPTPDGAAAELARDRFNSNPEGAAYGSNGWAFGRNATPDGHGVLLGNPHFPWSGPDRFWEVHLTIPGTLDVMGASGGMLPVVLIGFNRDVAWTHTVSTGQRFTLYELTLDPADPTVYLVDGQRRKMTARTVALPAGAEGSRPISKVFYDSEWGPIVAMPKAGLGWTASHAYALHDANTLNMRAGDTWMRMARAHDVGELRAAMGNQGLPWVNTIAADRQGNAMYADLSVVPDVSAAMLESCAPSPAAAALFDRAGLAVLDGSRSACAWSRDAAATQPGIIAARRMPVLVTPDWVQNSNDSYWLSNPDVPPATGISPLVGPVGTVQGLRTRSAIQEIRGRLAGSDGLAGDRMGPSELRSVIFRDRNFAGELVMDDLVAACKAADALLSRDAREGCRVLSAWDRTDDAGSAGAPLFREFWRKARGIPNVWRVPFDPGRPVATPSGLAMDRRATRDAVFQALAEAVALVRAAGFAPDVALGVPQSRVVHGHRVALHGGTEFEGVLNKLEAEGQQAIDAGGYRVDFGSSYLQVVTFDERGPLAQAILTYGQSGEPGSEHAYDQLPLFAAKHWQSLPFHPEDVEAQRIGQPLRLEY